MLKSDICAPISSVGVVMPFCALALTAPPLKFADPPVLKGVGVRTMVMVAVEFACKVGMVQVTVAPVEPPLQGGEEVEAPETKVTGTNVIVELMSSVTVILVATSGPLLVKV